MAKAIMLAIMLACFTLASCVIPEDGGNYHHGYEHHHWHEHRWHEDREWR